ncbi:MAG: universal stress protein [Cytophagales bacterium]|nr:universal stress protein [Cytophagales bacterium]
MKKILVPTDFSKEANYAMQLAAEIAERIEAELHLLHVMEIPYGSYSVMGEFIPSSSFENVFQVQLIKQTKRELDELVDDLVGRGINTTAHFVFGNTFSHIHKTVTAQDMDMIVMGSKGASGLSEFFIGSNAEKVIRHANCPVLTVKGETHLKDIKSFVYATDCTEEQEQVVGHVKALQELLGFQLYLVRVITPYNFLVKSSAMDQLNAFAEKHHFKNYILSTVEAEFAEEGILTFATHNKIDMAAMGTHGRTGLAHLFGGSVSESVANHADIPIWTLKMQEQLEEAVA